MKTNLQKQNAYKQAVRPGDVFALKYGEAIFLFGRVVAVDVAHGGFERGCIRIHIYRKGASVPLPPEGLIESGLLIPPQHVNALGFSKGFMPVIKHEPITPDVHCYDVCYRDRARKNPTYLDENGEPLETPKAMIGEWGLGNYLTVDDLISDALGMKKAEE